MRFASLGSGSEGNALVVEAGTTKLMLDCGFGLAETIFRLERLGLKPNDINGILVTHEHSDHIGGVTRFSRKFNVPIWVTYGALPWLSSVPSNLISVIDSHSEFAIRDLFIHPFPVPHDAREPVQFVFTDGVRRLGVVTDLGASTPHVENCLSGVDGLVIECNHDINMLMSGPYPSSLKRRVMGRFGHLDNEAASTLVSQIDASRLQHIIAAHLSKQNNHPELAKATLAKELRCNADWIGIADQATGFAWRCLN